MRLSDLKSGEKGVVLKVLGHGEFRKRIVEMGFIRGKTITVLEGAPLKDPIRYHLMGYDISLRKQEAQMIEVVSEGDVASILPKAEELPVLTEKYSPRLTNSRGTTADGKPIIRVAMVGNPNSGKTSLFNLASGLHEHVGNYSGVTIDAIEGTLDFEGIHFQIIDLPGTYSLSAYSPEEIFVRKQILEDVPDFIINVVDASNLERNLYLTSQLIDMNVPVVVALNMFDELLDSSGKLDVIELSKTFGVPMVPTVAKRSMGVDHLFHTIILLYKGHTFINEEGNVDGEFASVMNGLEQKLPEMNFSQTDEQIHDDTVCERIQINHGEELEKSIRILRQLIEKDTQLTAYSSRFLAIKLLEKDKEEEAYLRKSSKMFKEIQAERDVQVARLYPLTKEDTESAVANAKYRFIDQALRHSFSGKDIKHRKTTKMLDAILTHRILAFPLFLLLMFVIFEATFTLGQYPMDGIEWLVEQLGGWIEGIMPDGSLKDLLIDGIIGGVGGVIVFLPNILILYFFISFMEDSGYMSRSAFIMDKLMHKIGLQGKSFIPLIMGFGCNVPAIMATRTIENRRVRLITMLVNPFMSCTARLPIYLVLVGVFFPSNASLMLLLIYSIGIVLAILMALVFSRFLPTNDDTPFVMELPPYRMPTGKSIFRHTWEKGVQYLKKMGGIIMIASIIIWFLGYYPRGVAYETQAEQQANSYIGQIGKAVEPAIEPLGFDWKLGVGLLTGVGAKELVVSTLGVLYANDSDADVTSLAERIPITPLVAFCYMLFSLIYFPCIAAIAAIKNESGSWKWALFAAFYTTALAWVVTFLVYRIGSTFF